MVLLTGCGKGNPNNQDIAAGIATNTATEEPSSAEETTTPELIPAPADEEGNVIFPENSAITDQETIYYVWDDSVEETVVYFTEHHPEVKAIKEVIDRHLYLINTRDYRTIKGDEEYETYTQDFIEYLKEKNDIENSAKVYKDAKLVTTSLGVSEYESFEFNVPVTECKVTFAGRLRFDEISDEAAKESGAKAGQVYEFRALLKLVKQGDGTWKIDDKGQSGIWEAE